MAKCDTMALNFFAHSPLFAEIKPTSYLLVDPAFYADLDVLEKEGKGDLRQRIEGLKERKRHASFCRPILTSPKR